MTFSFDRCDLYFCRPVCVAAAVLCSLPLGLQGCGPSSRVSVSTTPGARCDLATVPVCWFRESRRLDLLVWCRALA
ncbi:uncharacterized protein LY79DRAFT_540287, partial [Colletotrichum navitas]